MSFFETIGLGLLTNFLSDLLKKKLKFKMNRTDVDKIADRLNLVLSLIDFRHKSKNVQFILY